MTTVLTSAKHWFISHQQAAFFIKVIFGSLMIALFAQISVPMYPVPITGQTLAVTVVGLSLGRKAGISAVLLYLFQGAIGLPVFASGPAGVAAFLGPTGGYLYGFIATVAILGYFSDKGILKSYFMSSVVAIVATGATFVFGLTQLSFFVPEGKLLQLGFYPFIIGGVIKAVLAATLVVPTHRFFSKL
ncbi:biotin transporter BioY [Psychrobacter sp.]|uniref:biotin transporter BioY n=1 Tax=Psychrobacter sp. TaxID=56811 RepID=UPI002648127E|nr:biotin transporter BioY [Psychrobacter sp.]MDN6308721.1 biotin transporter BioY [Psychrobacter sp.]